MTTAELCLISQPEDCFASTRYNITVYDVAGCSVYNQTYITDGVCTQVEVLQNSEDVCAPMEITIDALNPRVTYPTMYYTIGKGVFNMYPNNIIIIVKYTAEICQPMIH